MNLQVPRVPTVVAALSGTMLIRLSISGDYARYVKSIMRWPLLASGLILVAGALIGLFSRPHHDHDSLQDSHHDAHPSLVGWLLIIPVLAVLVVAPPPLSGWGLSGLANAGSSQISWSPLESTPGTPTVLSMWDFVGRALETDSPTVTNREVTLTGFIVEGSEITDSGVTDTGSQQNSFEVARYSIACCAADGRAARIRVVGSANGQLVGAQQRVTQTWVSITGMLERIEGDIPVVRARTAIEVPEPSNPYED